jgi:hypothetical protein
MIFKENRRAILYLVWGEKYIRDAINSINISELPEYPIFIIADQKLELECRREIIWKIVNFNGKGLLRKASLIDYLPKKFDSFLFLDSDVRVLQNITFGFDKAEQHGMAMAPAPHYSLDYFWDFPKVMDKIGMPKQSQLQHNSGVMFFKKQKIKKLFKYWKKLAYKYAHMTNNDQPLLSLAMEKIGFNPYTLSPSYNYRPFMQPVSGIVRIWHSEEKMPKGLNNFTKPWPPRFVKEGRIIQYEDL